MNTCKKNCFHQKLCGYTGVEFVFVSLACKSRVKPLAVTFVAIKPINPKYRTRMPASIRGDKADPKASIRLGTGSMLMSPRWMHAIVKVTSKREVPTKAIRIPEVSEGSILNLASHQFTVTVGGCSTITQRPVSVSLL